MESILITATKDLLSVIISVDGEDVVEFNGDNPTEVAQATGRQINKLVKKAGKSLHQIKDMKFSNGEQTLPINAMQFSQHKM